MLRITPCLFPSTNSHAYSWAIRGERTAHLSKVETNLIVLLFRSHVIMCVKSVFELIENFDNWIQNSWRTGKKGYVAPSCLPEFFFSLMSRSFASSLVVLLLYVPGGGKTHCQSRFTDFVTSPSISLSSIDR